MSHNTGSGRTTPRRGFWYLLAVAATTLLLVTPSSASDHRHQPHAGGSDWVGSWAAAVTPPDSRPDTQRFHDQTLRQVVHLSVGGDRFRLRLTNVHGTKPLSVGAVTVSPRRGGRGTPNIDPTTAVPVTFDGRSSTTVPVGAEWVSDPVELDVADNSDLVVSVHLPESTGRASVHYEGRSTTFLAPGDATSGSGENYESIGTARYFLDGVDVRTDSAGSVVFFGDSITDGVRSTLDANHRYPDVVADRLLKRPEPRELGVLNAGLSANRLLTDAGLGGEPAIARFERDILSQTGVRTVVLLEGINDIHHSAGAVESRELIGVYEQLIARAHEAGIRVVGGTITPFEGAPRYNAAGESDRRAVNEWIRESGAFDAVVDFDAVVRDPGHPSRLAPRYDTGDHVHPNDAGLAAMARAVEIRELY
ncbi:Lysophospholipase L1 [Actinopolyspora lacussalsi subsp. righensis]|uniref:Lysophospholipase L1 n=1 Tax=Actinopolyspora righensis TaxID=995060 RepID=A0A1I6Y2S3_9ACTN|nr:SGNH/GDSL hydrolase family protein [Actinopolyspora righensis]SFT44736.1 Lysophospholipase L1 [Actinopolyspora righensis]